MAQWIPWLADYEIGVRQIDDQHEELFRMFNELMEAIWDGRGKDALKNVLDFTAEYTATHFATEEDFMLRHDYPGYTEHRRVHEAFKGDVAQFIREYKRNGVNTEMVVKTISDLGQWTRDHIRDMDQELGQYLAVRLRES